VLVLATALGIGAMPGVGHADEPFAVPGTAGPIGEGGTYGQWGGTGLVETGVIAAGQVVLTATGTVNASTNTSFGQGVPPAGNGVDVCDTSCLAAWSLVVKIGDGPWQQGQNGPVTLSGTGPVVLAVNDGWYGDNSGGFSVTLGLPVEAALAALQDDAEQVESGTSLSSKLENARARYESGDLEGACGSLGAFTHQVEAQTPRKIDAETAQDLLDAAAEISAALGCES